MPIQSRRAIGVARRSDHAMTRKNGSESVMRRKSSVVALTGWAE